MSAEPFERDGVQGFLHRVRDGSGGLVLTHGAGSNAEAPVLIAVATAFAAAGMTVLRSNLAYRMRSPKGPPAPARAGEDRASLRLAVAALRTLVDRPIYLGGHSYGGRQASMLAAEDPDVADALLLLSYPLHPPGKPQQLRTQHFPELQLPSVFVHGSKDGFAGSDELASATQIIGAPTRICTIDGAGHDLKRGVFDLRPIIDALRSMATRT